MSETASTYQTLKYNWSRPIGVALLSIIIGGCTSKSSDQPKSTEVVEREKLLARGKTAYMTHCISCHNMNPKVSGSVGPEIYGSSEELIEARVVHGTYPEGYSPKRTTKLMVAIPAAKNDIEALFLFLNKN